MSSKKKTFLIENEFGLIEDMSTPSQPLTSFNVYRKREALTRHNRRKLYKSVYSLESAKRKLSELNK